MAAIETLRRPSALDSLLFSPVTGWMETLRRLFALPSSLSSPITRWIGALRRLFALPSSSSSPGPRSIVRKRTPPPTIPSIEEILACTDMMPNRKWFRSTTMVRLGEVVVKYGSSDCILVEAANLAFVSQQGNVPVPELYALLSDPETDKHFMVMQYIEGTALEQALPTLTAEEKLDVVSQLKAILHNLRSLKSPGYIGAADRRPCQDIIFADHHHSGHCGGPFASEDEFYDAICDYVVKVNEDKVRSAPLLRQIRSFTDRMPRHKIVFTHGDLQPKNIMVRQVDERNGSRKFELTLVDWESGGWYPAYWEFCQVTWHLFAEPPVVLEMMQDVFSDSNFEYELLYLQFIRGLMLW